MVLTPDQKQQLKEQVVSCLSSDKHIKKIVVFGSFIKSSEPEDMDIAVFQDSKEGYLPLALKYRKKTREISSKIPLDIFPIKEGVSNEMMLSEISDGEVVYEK